MYCKPTLCIFMTGLMFVLFPAFSKRFAGTIVAFDIYFCILFVFRQPANPLLDAWSVSELQAYKIPYVVVRK